MTSLPSLSDLHALSASTLDTEMKRDRDYYENDGYDPALTAAVKAFVLTAQAHIEASMGNERQVAPFFYDPSQRSGEGADVTATRQALGATYLRLRKAWIQRHFLWPHDGQDPHANFAQRSANNAPELCLIYAAHFAYAGDDGVRGIVESMLRSTEHTRDDTGPFTSLSTALMSLQAPGGADIPQQRLAKELSVICLGAPRAPDAAGLATISQVVRDLTLPPAIEYWYGRFKSQHRT